jgi:hypothetical protein
MAGTSAHHSLSTLRRFSFTDYGPKATSCIPKGVQALSTSTSHPIVVGNGSFGDEADRDLIAQDLLDQTP